MILDSNIIIYACFPENGRLRSFVAEHGPAVSSISYVEVLSSSLPSPQERYYLEQFFQIARMIPVAGDVLSRAVQLIQIRKMTLGDAIVASTALVHQLTLVTHAKEDYQWIEGLKLLDPLD